MLHTYMYETGIYILHIHTWHNYHYITSLSLATAASRYEFLVMWHAHFVKRKLFIEPQHTFPHEVYIQRHTTHDSKAMLNQWGVRRLSTSFTEVEILEIYTHPSRSQLVHHFHKHWKPPAEQPGIIHATLCIHAAHKKTGRKCRVSAFSLQHFLQLIQACAI